MLLHPDKTEFIISTKKRYNKTNHTHILHHQTLFEYKINIKTTTGR